MPLIRKGSLLEQVEKEDRAVTDSDGKLTSKQRWWFSEVLEEYQPVTSPGDSEDSHTSKQKSAVVDEINAGGGFVLPTLLSFFECRRRHSTTGGRIATRIVALTVQLQIW